MLLNLDWQHKIFNEDTENEFSVMLKPLDFPSYQRFLSLFNVASADGMSEAKKQEIAAGFNPMTNPEMNKIMKEVLPSHVKDVKGFQIQLDGEVRDVTINDIVEISQLVIIATTIMTELIAMSTIVGSEREDVKKPLPELSEESE